MNDGMASRIMGGNSCNHLTTPVPPFSSAPRPHHRTCTQPFAPHPAPRIPQPPESKDPCSRAGTALLQGSGGLLIQLTY